MDDLHLLPTRDEFAYVTELLKSLSWQDDTCEIRICRSCGARLSRFNPGSTCWHHDLESRPLPYGASCIHYRDCFTCPKKDCIAQSDSQKTHQGGDRNEAIKRLREAGQPVNDIAALYGLSSSAIRYIIARGNGHNVRVRVRL